jgi:chemotaxis protein MotB
MPRPHKCPECPKPGAPEYMNTYGDMMTLLVTFFVLLISYSTIESKKFNMAMSSLRGALGVLTSSVGSSLPIANIPTFNVGKSNIEETVEQKIMDIKDLLNSSGISDLVQMSQDGDKIHINIAEPMLFESGKALIKNQANDLLVQIAEILKIVSFEIRIEGHTDNIPINTAQFPSNWELSYSRALALANTFIDEGISPERFQVIGYGEYRPEADNSTPEGRSINRRVNIVVNLKDEIRKSLLPGE